MSKHASRVANAVHSLFKQQRVLAHEGRERFLAFNGKLAAAIIDSLGPVYIAAMKRSKVKDADWAVQAIEIQAREAAMQINEATNNLLDSDRTFNEVFGPDRAALIGLDQYDKAVAACEARGAKERGNRIEWFCAAKPCKFCAKLRGKVRTPGKAFAIWNGVPIYTAPCHPHCSCETRERV